MASDEIEIAFKKYKDGIEGMDDIEIAMSKDDFTAGYTQGRADAGKDIATLFSLLTDYEREDIMAQYCVCGSKNTRCQCQNDE